MERLQKILASAGFGSRRACEEIIRAGRVRVNGQPVKLGDSADSAHDTITVDGKRIHVAQTHTYIVVHKPKGVIGAAWDERGRQTVRDLVPVGGQLVPVGRLDMDSEGLVLLTDDGELTHRLTHPRYEHEKEYEVLVNGQPDEATLNRWRRGVELPDFDSHTLDGGRTLPAKVEIIRRVGTDGAWLRVTMREGRKRQIRRVASLLGHSVRQLVRVRIGPVHLSNLKPGQWRHLTPSEISNLKHLHYAQAQVSQISNPASDRREAEIVIHTLKSKIKNPKSQRRPR